jgi:hypothetical protein
MSITNAETIKALAGARDATLRASLAILVNGAGSHVEDLIQILAEVIDDHAMAYALRTGDYDYAGKLSIMAKHLEGLDAFIDNYDPTPAE